jgi:hypothetical protein
MESAERPPREGDWLAFVLPALGFCAVDCVAAMSMVRANSDLTLIAVWGAIMGQILWGAAWCALGPGRWLHRFVAVVAAGVLVAGVMLGGVYSQRETAMPRETIFYGGAGRIRIVRTGPDELQADPLVTARNRVLRCVSAFPLALLIAQFPLLGFRALRGWRIVFHETESCIQSPDARTFGITDLFAVTAAVAIVLGFWRIQSGVAADKLGDGLALFVGWAGFACIAGGLALVLVPLVLGARPQPLSLRVSLCASIVSLGVIAPAAAVLMMYPSLWIARDVGYRLVGLKRT